MADAYTLTLIRHEEIAQGTMAFYFQRPEGFLFKAGQNGDFTLLDPRHTDAEGNKRTFSFASAPSENNLMIATRIRESAFKQTLKALPVGASLSMEGPYGSFMLHNDSSRPAVFLIGGIGITPIRSMLVEAAAHQSPHTLYLFYSNRRPEDAPFLDELVELQEKNSRYMCIPTMTAQEQSDRPWSGETGPITYDMITHYVKQGQPIFYLAGPEKMVAAMRTLLNSAGINDDDIRAEEFPGY